MGDDSEFQPHNGPVVVSLKEALFCIFLLESAACGKNALPLQRWQHWIDFIFEKIYDKVVIVLNLVDIFSSPHWMTQYKATVGETNYSDTIELANRVLVLQCSS